MIAVRHLGALAALLVGCGEPDRDSAADAATDTSVTDGAVPHPEPDVRADVADIEDVDLLDVIAPDGDAAEETSESPRVRLFAPASAPVGHEVPVVVYLVDGSGQIDPSISGRLTLRFGDANVDVRMRRGVGSFGATMPSSTATIALESGESIDEILVEATAARSLAGVLGADELRWSDARIEVTGDVEVPVGQTLVIDAGTRVELAAGANLLVRGSLEVGGVLDAPVVFASRDAQPWGGLVIDGSATIAHAMFVEGGGDATRQFGHSNSQPVIFGRRADVVLRDSVIQDSPGKAMGAELGTWLLERNLITRTDTGGEFSSVALTVRDSHFFDFPSIDAGARDDDNDAIYLLGDPADENPPAILIERTTFIGGADDGIDHNGSTVTLVASWVEDFDHECFAASSGGRVDVSDTALIGCEQGLEAGYGAPDVRGRNLLVMECDAGVRFGDSYDRDLLGQIEVLDSVIINNHVHDVRNHDNGTGAAVDGAVEIHTSVVGTDGGFVGEGNYIGQTELGADLRLITGAAGTGIATGGNDPGLVTPRPR